MIRGIIYMYTSPSGKSYVGQTIDEKRRRSNWFSSTYSYAGDAINRARAKYGRDSFTYTVLFSHVFSSKKEAEDVLNLMEQYYIQKYNTKKQGYNCEEGGKNHFGYKLSEQAKRNITKGIKSWVSTPEGRQKLSLAHKGKSKKSGYRLEDRFKPVVQLSLDGDFIQEFPSLRDAEEFLYGGTVKHRRSNIGSVCNGSRDSAKGYKWLYKDDYYTYFLHPNRTDIPQRVQRAIDYITDRHTPKVKVKKKYKRKPYIMKEGPRKVWNAQNLGQYGSDLQLIRVWSSASEASKVLGISSSNISRSARTLGMYMGSYWRKYNGEQIIQPKPKKVIKKPKANKAVIQMDESGMVLNTYNSIGEACASVKASNRALMSRCLNGKAHTAYGYKWKFLNCA